MNESVNNALAELILKLNNEYKGIFGYRRMTMNVNKILNKKYNVKRIRRIMRKLNIKSVIRRTRYHYISSKPEETATNVLARNFTAIVPNQKWCTDVTEFKIQGNNQKLYLSAIIDLYDKRIVSWTVGTSNNNNLVFRNFIDAISRYPDMHGIFHSDRGFQYTSRIFHKMLMQQGVIQSMSRVSHCIDNGVIEGFWGIIKSEMYYLNKSNFNSIEKLLFGITEFIDFYNNDRLQSNLGNKTPFDKFNEGIKKMKEFNNYPLVIVKPSLQNIIYL